MHTEKEKQLLLILQKQDQWVTTDVLAKLCNVSTRSIRKYVASINATQRIILSSAAGYQVDKHVLMQDVETSVSTLATPDDRIRYCTQKLLHSKKSIDRYELCEEMFISASTLKHDLIKVKEALHDYDLYLHQKGDLIWCEGLEKNRRKMVSALLYQECRDHFMNDELIRKTFSHIPVLQLKQALLTMFHEFHYFTSDDNLSNLLLHLCISVDRIQNGCSIASDSITLDTDAVEYRMAKQVSEVLEASCTCHIEPEEVNEIALLILSRSSHMDTSINNTYKSTFLNKEEQSLLLHMLQCVNDAYYVDLNNEHFITRFSLHLHNLLIRTHTRYLAKNNLSKEMKLNFPLIYDIAVYITNMIQEYTKTKINDDEIAYIALHIGSNLDEQTSEQRKINAVVLCPQYYDLDHQIMQKLEQHFQRDLKITQIVTCEEELQDLSFQLLISTNRLLHFISLPCVVVHPLLTSKDITNIEKALSKERRNLKHYTMKRHLREIFPESLFLCDFPFTKREEALSYMSDLLNQQGIVNDGFYHEILERERVSSTAFDHFAIPHSLHMNANQTCVCTSIHHHSIDWNHHDVNIIFLIAVNHLERKRFKDIFSSLADVLLDPVKLATLLKSKTYESFIEVLSSFL